MRHLFTAALAFALAGSAYAQQKLVPVDESGVQKLIASNKGKVVLVNFWATWCVPCREEMPQLLAMENRLRPQGLKLLFISADEPEQEADARKFLQSKKVAFPAYLKSAKNDEAFINAFDPKWSGAVPSLFLYDKTGKRVRSFSGEAEMSAVEAAVKKLL